MDQGNIQQSLACLPVFLAGCQTLLVVAGPTYCSRLWCVMELFTFARSDRLLYTSNLGGHDCAPARRSKLLTHSSLLRVPVGGDQRRVEIHLIAHPDDDQTKARRLLKEQFASFDAGKARCFLASDREHLLAVIEAGFGDFYDFNRVARSLFASRISSRHTSQCQCGLYDLVCSREKFCFQPPRARSQPGTQRNLEPCVPGTSTFGQPGGRAAGTADAATW
eukprot:scaffold85130_cov78-Phaeocystis_antarctica.AAC.4